MRKRIEQVRNYIDTTIWQIPMHSVSFMHRMYLYVTKVFIISIKGYVNDDSAVKASALTFFSLLSFVPILAIAFGISQGFGLESVLEEVLVQQLAGQEEILAYLLDFSRTMLSNTKGGVIAGVSFVFLLWSVMKLLRHIENAFNEIWNVQKSRSFLRQMTDYVSIIIFTPILIILSSSVTVYVATELNNMTDPDSMFNFVSPAIYSSVKLISYSLVWIMLTLIYLIMPNARVSFGAALIAGVIAGTGYQLIQWGYINFQVLTARNNAIYGSFAALPLFIIWIQMSWFSILFGAQIAFAVQNVHLPGIKTKRLAISGDQRNHIALLITHLTVLRFVKKETPYSILDLSMKLNLVQEQVKEIVLLLADAKILVAIKPEDELDLIKYQPAIDTQHLSMYYVLNAIQSHTASQIDFPENEANKQIESHLAQFKQLTLQSDNNMLLKDIPE